MQQRRHGVSLQGFAPVLPNVKRLSRRGGELPRTRPQASHDDRAAAKSRVEAAQANSTVRNCRILHLILLMHLGLLRLALLR